MIISEIGISSFKERLETIEDEVDIGTYELNKNKHTTEEDPVK